MRADLLLHLAGGIQRVRSRGEGRHDLVAHGLDDRAAVLLGRGAHDLNAGRDHVARAQVAEELEQARRAHDVGEHNGELSICRGICQRASSPASIRDTGAGPSVGTTTVGARRAAGRAPGAVARAPPKAADAAGCKPDADLPAVHLEVPAAVGEHPRVRDSISGLMASLAASACWSRSGSPSPAPTYCRRDPAGDARRDCGRSRTTAPGSRRMWECRRFRIVTSMFEVMG